jgi:hypothetical protein
MSKKITIAEARQLALSVVDKTDKDREEMYKNDPDKWQPCSECEMLMAENEKLKNESNAHLIALRRVRDFCKDNDGFIICQNIVNVINEHLVKTR